MDYSGKISRQVAGIPRSGIRDFFELVQGRDDVISLGVGEPDFSTPWHIREAAIYSLEKGLYIEQSIIRSRISHGPGRLFFVTRCQFQT